MRILLVIAFAGSYFFNNIVYSQQQNIINEIVQSIKSNDSKKLARFFNSTIDLELEDLDGSYSSTQAELIIKDFFKNSPIKSFTKNHQGSSNDGSKYIIGTYTTSEKKYRVYILLKKPEEKLLIHQLQFEED